MPPTDLNASEVNKTVSKLIRIYKAPAIRLARHLYTAHNYSYADVGKILGISRQATRDTYPKGDK